MNLKPLYLLGFTIVVNYTITSPTILPFIISLTNDSLGTFMYALEMSLNAVSQVVCAIIAGVLSKRYSMKILFIAFQIIAIIGVLLYCFAAWPINSVWVIVLSRFLVGAQGGTMGLCASYISTVKEDKAERLIAIANFRAVCIFGVLPTSILAGLLTLVPAISIGPYELNEYVSSSWLNLVMQLIGLYVCVVNIKSIDRNGVEKRAKAIDENNNNNFLDDDEDDYNNNNNNNNNNNRGNNNIEEKKAKGVYISTGVVLSFIIYLFFGYAITTISYLMPVVLQEGYQWSTSAYSVVVIIFSIVGIAGSLFVRILAKFLKSHTYFAIVPMIGGVAVSVVISSLAVVGVNQIDEWLATTCFVVGVEAAFFFFSVAQSVLSSSFSQIIPREYVVSMMPLSSALYAIGKIAGPIICEIELQIMDIGLIYFVFFIVSAIILFVTILLSHHFNPPTVFFSQAEDINQNPTDSKKAYYGSSKV